MKLVPDWKFAWRFLSVQFALLGAVASGLWAAVPAFQGVVPPTKFAILCVGASVLAVLLRLINQKISGASDGVA